MAVIGALGIVMSSLAMMHLIWSNSSLFTEVMASLGQRLLEAAAFSEISTDMVYSLVMEVNLVLGLNRVMEARPILSQQTHGTELDDPNHGGFHTESGSRGICSKKLSLVMVV